MKTKTVVVLLIVLLMITGCNASTPGQTPMLTASPFSFLATPTARATLAASPTLVASPTPVAEFTPRLLPPTPAPFSASKLGTSEKDVTYCAPDGVAQKMDIYFPKQTEGKPAPALVFVHGGGWSSGDKASGNLIPFSDLAARGYFVAAINYRLAPQYKFPAMIQDVKCAVRFLRANAANYNIDPNRIGAWGGSAGGHLVALLGLTDASAGFDVGAYAEQSSRVQAVVDMFGPTDFTATDIAASHAQVFRSVFVASSREDPILVRASPVTYISKDDPPFLILQGEKDNLVLPTQSQVLYDRLKAAGLPATLVMVKNAGHGLVPTGGAMSPSRAELIRMVTEFFDRNLKAGSQ